LLRKSIKPYWDQTHAALKNLHTNPLILTSYLNACKTYRHTDVTSSRIHLWTSSGKKGGSPYLITKHRVPELIPVLGSKPAGDVSHKPGGRLPLLSDRPAVTPSTLKRAATNFAAW